MGLTIEEIGKFFFPSSPIENKQNLYGRDCEYDDLHDYLLTKGAHVVIIGERGIGKTSLCKTYSRSNKVKSYHISCSSDSSFESIFFELLKLAEFNTCSIDESETKKDNLDSGLNNPVVGKVEKSWTKERTTSKHIPDLAITKVSIFDSFKKITDDNIIVIDELDRLSNSEYKCSFCTSLSETIKYFSDNAGVIKTKIVLIGIANTIDEMINGYTSISRNLKEIHLKRIDDKYFFDFFKDTLTSLKLQFEPPIVEEIVKDASGSPSYIQKVGYETARIAIPTKNSIVTYKEYQSALKKTMKTYYREYSNLIKNILKNKYIDAMYILLLLTELNEKDRTVDSIEKIVNKVHGELSINKENPFYEPFLKITENLKDKTNLNATMKALIRDNIIHIIPVSNEIKFNDHLFSLYIRKMLQEEDKMSLLFSQ